LNREAKKLRRNALRRNYHSPRRTSVSGALPRDLGLHAHGRASSMLTSLGGRALSAALTGEIPPTYPWCSTTSSELACRRWLELARPLAWSSRIGSPRLHGARTTTTGRAAWGARSSPQSLSPESGRDCSSRPHVAPTIRLPILSSASSLFRAMLGKSYVDLYNNLV
jgi:hypothetical protein